MGEIKVLHVEDDPGFGELTAYHLERLGIEVETVRDPRKVVEEVDPTDYDCVVSDYEMYGMDGVELLSAIEDDLDSAFIIYTIYGDEVEEEVESAGVDDLVEKQPSRDNFELLASKIVDHARA